VWSRRGGVPGILTRGLLEHQQNPPAFTEGKPVSEGQS